MPDILDNTVTVTVGGDTFEFRLPSPLDMAKIGMVASSIRREADPAGLGYEEGLDWQTAVLIRAMATMVVLLERSSAKWAFSEVRDAKGVATVSVDHKKFPPKASLVLPEIYDKLQEEVSRFLSGGTANGDAAGTETVESVANPVV